MRKRVLAAFAAYAALLGLLDRARASDVGHYDGGVYSIRDYFIPPASGLYGALYSYGYRTDRLNDNHGNKITTASLGLPPLDMDVSMYVLAPTLIWINP